MLETLWNDHNAEPDCSADEALTVCLEVDPPSLDGVLVGWGNPFDWTCGLSEMYRI